MEKAAQPSYTTIVQIELQIARWERKKTCTASSQFYKRINQSFKIGTVFFVFHVTFDFKTKMSWLEYRNGVLHAEDVRVQTLADRFATPLYVYSKAGIEQNLKAYQEAMEVDKISN